MSLDSRVARACRRVLLLPAAVAWLFLVAASSMTADEPAAQARPPAAPAAALPPADYVGSDTCLGCHEDANSRLPATAHGRAAHPGVAGGGAGLRDVPRAGFPAHRGPVGRPLDSQVRADGAAGRQRDLPVVPHLVHARAVGGQHPRRPQPVVRHLPQRAHARRASALLAKASRERAVRHLPPRPGQQGQARLAHAGGRGQDAVLVLPQPARRDQREAAAHRQLDQRELRLVPHREARPVPVRARGRTRKLRQLPRSAWLVERPDAGRQGTRCCASAAISARAIRRRSTTAWPCRTRATASSAGLASTATSRSTGRTTRPASR